MITAIIIFVLAGIYSFKEYYSSHLKKDLWFSILLFVSAGWTLWQTLQNNEDTQIIKDQTANTQRLEMLDSTFSTHLDTLANIDTSISSQVFKLTKENINLSDSIRKLDSIIYSFGRI